MSYAEIHSGQESTRFAANLHTRVVMLRAGALALPATVNEGDEARGNAWVCSPQTTYCDYAAEEAARALHPLLAAPVRLVCRGYGRLMRAAQLDRAVTINNWLLSTNLYPALQTGPLDALLAQARREWPGHALWFRSLNMAHNADWLAHLRARGFVLIPSRQVYLFTTPGGPDMRRDRRLLRTTALHKVGPSEFRDDDFARIAELYAALYIDKYSGLNPRYNAHFMRSWHEGGLLAFHGFRDDTGLLQAVVGLFRQHGTTTAPVVGYNTALPLKLGLYRLLMATVLAQGGVVNLSAGAAHFKRLRGGCAEIEYSAVFARHLPWRRRAVIGVLRVLTNWIGVPVMKRFKL